MTLGIMHNDCHTILYFKPVFNSKIEFVIVCCEFTKVILYKKMVLNIDIKLKGFLFTIDIRDMKVLKLNILNLFKKVG